jgi:hypothetical protein
MKWRRARGALAGDSGVKDKVERGQDACGEVDEEAAEKFRDDV